MVSPILGVNVGIRNEKTMDIRLSRAVCKAFKQLLKEIENEPELIIESALDNTYDTTIQTEDIQSWLFRRKEANHDDQPDS